MYRIGMIGAGTMAATHIEAYTHIDNADVVAICDINLDAAQRKAKTYNIASIYTDYGQMLSECSLDGVHVITSNNTHARITIDALNAKVHVLCEKPPAMNAQEAIEMEITAERNARLLMYGLPFRFSDKTVMIKRLRKMVCSATFISEKQGSFAAAVILADGSATAKSPGEAP